MKIQITFTFFITMFIMIPVMLVCQVPDIKLNELKGKQTPVVSSGNDGQLLVSSNEIAIARPVTTAEHNIYTEKLAKGLVGDDNPVRISKISPGYPSPNLTDSETIRWDNGTNYDIAGIAGGGIFDVAAYFPASLMIHYIGYRLNKVEIYIGESPVSCELRIYGLGTSNSPGMLLRSQTVNTTPNSWNLIDLSNTLDITGQDLWISYSLNHLDGTFSAGIDAGPAIAGYGDMISFNGGPWYTLSSLGNSYNWNIAGYLSFICGSNIGDGEGNVYGTIEIGNQCWMTENLNIGSFINSSANQTNNNTIEKYCYDNLESWCNLYGGLYQWNEMMQYNSTAGTRGICPEGWHIPARDEWTILIDFLGGQSLAGEPMKSVRTVPDDHPRWDSPNIATNLSFFSALSGGVYQGYDFMMLGIMGYWWSSTGILLTPFSSYVALMNAHSNVNRCGNDTSYAYSVRCLLDNNLTSVDAGDDVSICEGEDYQTIASATNYESIVWTTGGDGFFDDPNLLTPVYIPGLSDYQNGSVELCITAYPIPPSTTIVTDCMTLFFQQDPDVFAGTDATISESVSYSLSDASVFNYSTLYWETSGDGFFDDATLLSSTYTPGLADISAGTVELCLTAYPIEPCPISAIDCMTLTIIPEGPQLQITEIPENWSSISSYLEPFNPSMAYFFAEMINQNKLEVMLGKTGIYWPSGSINTIGNWDVYQAYKIKMNAPGWLELIGEIPEDKTITLNAGANYIPVLSMEYYPAEDIFEQLGDDLIFAYDLYAQLLHWPQGGIYSLEVFEPGKGYLVGMSQPGQATYNPPTKSISQNYVSAKPKVYENAPWSITKSGSTHLISINRSALEELDFGDYIGVFNNEGVCAGFTQYDDETGNLLLVAYGNDFTTKANNGLADGEFMTFRIFNSSTNTEKQVSVAYDASMPNTGTFADNGLSMIIRIKTGAVSVDDEALKYIQIYPNPTDGTFTIEGIEGNINVRIYNAFGGEIYHNELNLPAKVDLSSQPKGMYFIRVETDNSAFFKKLVIN